MGETGVPVRHVQPSPGTPRSEITGSAVGRRRIPECEISTRRPTAHPTGTRADDVQRGRALAGLVLHEPRDRDVVRRQPPGDVREHARPVVHLEVHVERETTSPCGSRSSSRQQASFWRKPVPVVPMTLIMSDDDRRGRLEAAGARALEGDLADRVALQHHRVEGPLDGGERVVPVDERGLDAHVVAAVRRASPRRRGAPSSPARARRACATA